MPAVNENRLAVVVMLTLNQRDTTLRALRSMRPLSATIQRQPSWRRTTPEGKNPSPPLAREGWGGGAELIPVLTPGPARGRGESCTWL